MAETLFLAGLAGIFAWPLLGTLIVTRGSEVILSLPPGSVLDWLESAPVTIPARAIVIVAGCLWPAVMLVVMWLWVTRA